MTLQSTLSSSPRSSPPASPHSSLPTSARAQNDPQGARALINQLVPALRSNADISSVPPSVRLTSLPVRQSRPIRSAGHAAGDERRTELNPVESFNSTPEEPENEQEDRATHSKDFRMVDRTRNSGKATGKNDRLVEQNAMDHTTPHLAGQEVSSGEKTSALVSKLMTDPARLQAFFNFVPSLQNAKCYGLTIDEFTKAIGYDETAKEEHPLAPKPRAGKTAPNTLELNPLIFGASCLFENVQLYFNENHGGYELYCETRCDIELVATSACLINDSPLTTPPVTDVIVDIRGRRLDSSNVSAISFFKRAHITSAAGVRCGQILQETVKAIKSNIGSGSRMEQEIVYEVQFPKTVKLRLGDLPDIGTQVSDEETEMEDMKTDAMEVVRTSKLTF